MATVDGDRENPVAAAHVSTHAQRSVSQVEQYEGCPMKYYLQRVARVPQIPSWSLIGGRAFHDVVRQWETNDERESPDLTAKAFVPALTREIADTVLSSETKLLDWHAANRGIEGREWWLDKGPEMAARYVEAQAGRNYDVVKLSDDVLACEVGFTLALPGLPPLRGYLDQLIRYHNGDYGVVDLKTGSHMPGDLFQLRVYQLAATEVFELAPDPTVRWFGSYYRARNGELTQPVALERARSLPEVAYRVSAMHAAENAGLFPARPGNFCSSCSVRPYCPAKGDPDKMIAWSDLPVPALDQSLTQGVLSST